MTLIGFGAGLLFMAAGALYYKAWRDRRERRIDREPRPSWISQELQDIEHRRAWDRLDDDERAELLNLPKDEARWAITQLAWLAQTKRELADVEDRVLEEGTERLLAELATLPASPGDWGPAYG